MYDLLEPFVNEVREICRLRDKGTSTTKYTSLLKYLRVKVEIKAAAYMEKSWSHRVDQWATFGRLGSCVNTSMLCERFHKTLKHDILGGKANVRIDSLIQLLIRLTVEAEEEREVMVRIRTIAISHIFPYTLYQLHLDGKRSGGGKV
ncbi:hypothetical protein Y032_0044g938 [Ancylostoma ceylanicum]|uniref:Uncharacterized protein n=1 Tax=Ancylostoma ceylanicum TaxID=53326 RepID=A0A016UDV6_9BILA|nr:hypothetical protein Y032_0044g938 [Ancylostoma ceylanicum]